MSHWFSPRHAASDISRAGRAVAWLALFSFSLFGGPALAKAPDSTTAKPSAKASAKPAAKSAVKSGRTPAAKTPAATGPGKAETADVARVPADTQPLLWEVRDGDKKLYLTGTVHVGKAEFFPLHPAIDKAFAEAKVLVVEADITDEVATAKTSLRQFLPPPTTLYDVVPKELADDVIARLGAIGLPPAFAQTLKPVMAGVTLSMIEFDKAGYSPKYGVDLHFLQRAKADGKRVVELESIEQQMDVLDSLDRERQRVFLAGTLEEAQTGKVKRDFGRMVDAWRQGRLGGIEAYARDAAASYQGAEEVLDRMIWARHAAMVTKLEKLLQSGETAFVAVGALHLATDKGLLKLLADKGYAVIQK